MTRVDEIINSLRKYARRNKAKIKFGKNCAYIECQLDEEMMSMAVGLEFDASEVYGVTHCKWSV
jgi:hypothetical protein